MKTTSVCLAGSLLLLTKEKPMIQYQKGSSPGHSRSDDGSCRQSLGGRWRENFDFHFTVCSLLDPYHIQYQ
jgi:hypothetical protein